MVELVISAPDTVAVLAGGMPDFGAAQVAALAALYPSGENVNTAVPAQALATSLQLTLDHVKTSGAMMA